MDLDCSHLLRFLRETPAHINWRREFKCYFQSNKLFVKQSRCFFGELHRTSNIYSIWWNELWKNGFREEIWEVFFNNMVLTATYTTTNHLLRITGGPIELCTTNRNFSIRLHRISTHFPHTTSERYNPETVLTTNAF